MTFIRWNNDTTKRAGCMWEGIEKRTMEELRIHPHTASQTENKMIKPSGFIQVSSLSDESFYQGQPKTLETIAKW